MTPQELQKKTYDDVKTKSANELITNIFEQSRVNAATTEDIKENCYTKKRDSCNKIELKPNVKTIAVSTHLANILHYIRFSPVRILGV